METIELTKKDIKEWAKALRSGEYMQGHGYLCQDLSTNPKKQKFCCLGVACDLFLDGFWTASQGYWTMDGRDDMPPEALIQAIDEALSVNRKVLGKGLLPCQALAILNDGYTGNNTPPLNFHEIADLIDQAAGIKK